MFWPLIYDRALWRWLDGGRHSGRLKHICLCCFFVWPTHCIRRQSETPGINQMASYRAFGDSLPSALDTGIRATGLRFTLPQPPHPFPLPFPFRYAAQRADWLTNWTASSFWHRSWAPSNGRHRHTTTKDEEEVAPTSTHFWGGGLVHLKAIKFPTHKLLNWLRRHAKLATKFNYFLLAHFLEVTFKGTIVNCMQAKKKI